MMKRRLDELSSDFVKRHGELALQRIEDGEYGLCQQCDGVIAKTRLNAIPYTPLCIKCAANRDQLGPVE